MISNEVESALIGASPSTNLITSSIAALQGELSLSHWDPEATNTPFASLFSLNGTQSLAVAYVTMEGGDAVPDTHPFLRFYDDMGGYWKEKSTAPTVADFESCTFSLAKLKSGDAGEAWFLAWGIPFGSSHALQNIRLYAFDGYSVRTVWKRDRLYGGNVTVGPSDVVTLDYFDESNLEVQKHEVLHVTPDGLQ